MFGPKQFLCILSYWLLIFLLNSPNGNGLIVPDQVSSGLVYFLQQIPRIHKGTDSRLGFGFRLGEHADFQLILELGPQNNTRPLGEQFNETTRKRKTVKKTLPVENNAMQQLQLLYKMANRIKTTEPHTTKGSIEDKDKDKDN